MSITVERRGDQVDSWVPLTTTFTPPPGCESSFRLIGGFGLLAFDPGYGRDVDTAVKCVPSAVTTWWDHWRPDYASDIGGVIIWPLTCPYMWTTFGTWVTDMTTQVMCCPS